MPLVPALAVGAHGLPEYDARRQSLSARVDGSRGTASRVLRQVLYQAGKARGVLPGVPQRRVTTPTKKPSNGPRVVIVVHVQTLPLILQRHGRAGVTTRIGANSVH